MKRGRRQPKSVRLAEVLCLVILASILLSLTRAYAGSGKVHGTAMLSNGAPLAAGLVSLIDSSGHTASATTNAKGKFSIKVDPAAGPYLLQTTPTDSSPPLYGFALTTGIADIDVYTDLILNMLYAALSTTTAGQFEALAPLPPAQSVSSMTDNLQLVSPLTQNLILSWLVADRVKLKKFNFMAYRFSANGKKFAKLLQETSITSPYSAGSETVTISDGSTTQSITFSGVAPAGESQTGDVLASSTTNTGLQQITTAPATAILVSAEQAAEFEGIQALLAQLQSIVTTKGKNLSSSDIQPLFSQLTPPYLRGGEDLEVDTADQVTALRGVKMSNVTVTQLNSVQQDPVDPSKNDLNVVYQYNIKQNLTAPGVTEVFQCSNPFASGGSCDFVGNQQIAQTTDAVTAITSTTSDSNNGTATGPALEVDVLAPQGTLSGVSVNDTSHVYFNDSPVPHADVITQSFFPEPNVPLSPPFMEDEYRLVLSPLATIPAAGMDFSLTVTPTAGGTAPTYITSLSGSAGEPIALLQPSLTGDHSLNSAPLGKSTVVKWGLPSYPLQSISLTGQVVATCGITAPASLTKALAATSTSGTLKFPSLVNSSGDVQEVDINLNMVGVNGASSHLLYKYGLCAP